MPAVEARRSLSADESYVEEHHFWENLIVLCLRPKLTAFGQKDDLDKELEQLRNTAVLTVAVANIMWIVTITTLDKHADLQVSDTTGDDITRNDIRARDYAM